MLHRPLHLISAIAALILGVSLLSAWGITTEAAPENFYAQAATPTNTAIPTSSLPGSVIALPSVGFNHAFTLDSSDVPFITYYVEFSISTILIKCNTRTDCSTPTQYYSQWGAEPAVAVNSQGIPIVAVTYSNSLTHNMRLIFCTTPQCNYLSSYDVDSQKDPGHYASIALDNNVPVVSYYEATDSKLKMARCNSSSSCSPINSTVRIIDSVGVGEYTSLALTSGGFPVISYYDWINRDLKLAICSNKTCDTGTVTIRRIDSTGEVGKYTSVALTSDNIPIITYYDSTNARLKMARCNNPTCDAPTIQVLDASGQTGPYSSVKVLQAAGNLPIIAYHYYATRDLRMALCYDTDCSTMAYFTLDSVDVTGTYVSLKLDSQNRATILYSAGWISDQGRLYVGDYSFNTLPTLTPTDTPTPTPTYTPTNTPTDTPTFTPSPTATAVPTAAPVAAPVRNHYINGNPVLSWSGLTWAAYYEVEIDDSSGFVGQMEYSGSVNGLEMPLPTMTAGLHYWRVRGCRAADDCGLWSNVESFSNHP